MLFSIAMSNPFSKLPKTHMLKAMCYFQNLWWICYISIAARTNGNRFALKIMFAGVFAAIFTRKNGQNIFFYSARKHCDLQSFYALGYQQLLTTDWTVTTTDCGSVNWVTQLSNRDREQDDLNNIIYFIYSPMIETHFSLMIPLGKRWKSNSVPLTTTVWPALLPPYEWYKI